jgi:hypothetical protein
MSENLRIWEKLEHTDPKHTKGFTRSGGFKGTAVKPMWSNLRMTEMFGPCGLGWGTEQPVFETHTALDEMLVFCTVGLWYREKPDGERGLVYGVGGDKYVIKQSAGLRTSDEAFKMAYTDALSNAMKFIGVAADVHMGLFDDSKYVEEMKAEFAPKKEPQPAAEVIADDKQMAKFWGRCKEFQITKETLIAELTRAGVTDVKKIPLKVYDDLWVWMAEAA